ncbi:hypothetical protein ACF5W4_09145 [Bacillota bacterium Lsc_1132]
MGWTLAGLFGISAILLILSIIKSLQASKEEQKRIDLAHIALVKDINDLQESIRNIELNMEVIMKEAGIQLSPNEIQIRREVLDLYKRGYSIESIAEKKQVSESEISQMLAPFQAQPEERGKVANEI